MRYVLAVFFAVMTVLVLETVISSGGPLTQLQIEEGAPTARQLAPIADPVTPTREVVALEPSAAVESHSPLERFLLVNPGSPLSLLPVDEATKYLPTRENFIAWNLTVDEYDAYDLEALPYTGELAYSWKLCKEHQALRAFCLDYEDREFERWLAGEASVALEDELQPVAGYIATQLEDGAEVWDAINVYSSDAIEHIRAWGEETDSRSRPPSWSKLFRVLSENGTAPWYAVRDVILKGPKR